MSKSKDNIINIFLPDKKLRKQIMGIQTDSTPLEEPKDPESCNVFALYKIVASASDLETMRQNYLNGGYGYGHAKQALYEALVDRFAQARTRYHDLMADPSQIDKVLLEGADRARETASQVLSRVRAKVGY